MKTRKLVAVAAALGVALAGIAIATPATADPVSNGYVLVGSDTLLSLIHISEPTRPY